MNGRFGSLFSTLGTAPHEQQLALRGELRQEVANVLNEVCDQWNDLAWKGVLALAGYDAPELTGSTEPEWGMNALREVSLARSRRKLDPQRALSWTTRRLGETRTLHLEGKTTTR
eukprot:853371-Pyramimonas_sp.AAC.1